MPEPGPKPTQVIKPTLHEIYQAMAEYRMMAANQKAPRTAARKNIVEQTIKHAKAINQAGSKKTKRNVTKHHSKSRT